MQKRHKFTLIAFILGIVSIVVPFAVFTPVSIVAIVLGIIAMRQTKKEELPGKGLAITGVVCGSIAFVVMFIVWLLTAAELLGVIDYCPSI